MSKRLLVLIPLLAAAITHGQTDQKAIRSLFERQSLAINKSDVDMYMTTVDPQSKAFKTTKEAMSGLFKTYKIKSKLESLKVVSLKGSNAEVSTVIVTTKVSGPAFRDNRVTMSSKLVKRNGKWFNSDSKMMKLDYLN